MKAKVKNIYQKINQVIAAIEVIQKKEENTNKDNMINTHDEVKKVLRTQMVQKGIVMIPDICEVSQNGFKAIVKMAISFVNIDNPQDKIQVNSMGYGIDHLDSGVGKAVSYAVNYALFKMFWLKGYEEVENSKLPHIPQRVETVSKEQLGEILRIAKLRPKKLEKILELLGIQDVSQIPANCYDRVLAAFKRYEAGQS